MNLATLAADYPQPPILDIMALEDALLEEIMVISTCVEVVLSN